MIAEGVLKIGPPNRLCDISGRHIHVEVASQQDDRACVVPLRILKSLFHLSTPEPVVAATFKMQVIGNNCFAPYIRIGNKCQATSEPLLKWLDLWQKPMWLPEFGLLLEPEDTRIRQRPTGQRRLAMVSGGIVGTLRQFLKLTPKGVIEFQVLCYLPRNIKAVRAPGI